METLNSEQKKRIESWSTQRDNILAEIGVLETKKGELKKSNKEAADALTDIQLRTSKIEGRIDILKENETALKKAISKDVSELTSVKSVLQSEIDSKKAEIKTLDKQKDKVLSDIKELINIHDKVFERSTKIDKNIGEVVKVGEKHISNITELATELKTVFNDMIARGEANVKQTNIILEKLPRYIFELQKPIPVRRIQASEIARIDIHPDQEVINKEKQ